MRPYAARKASSLYQDSFECIVIDKHAQETNNVCAYCFVYVDKQLFEDYYVSFANSYARALGKVKEELKVDDVISTAYMLMGITNFLGLRAIFENMTDAQIDEAIDNAIMPILEKGMFR